MPDTRLELHIDSTALVVIDLQEGVARREGLGPRSGAEVVENAARLADAFRAKGGLVVLTRVKFSPDGGDLLTAPVEEQSTVAAMPPGGDEFVPEMSPRAGDLTIVKRQWGAFYGTDLDLQLRRRGINTIVLTGIATNLGVESTARAAHEHGYALILVEDAMTSLSADAHTFAVKTIFPRLGRVRSTDEVIEAL